ncbi:hypothetical protein [Micromonospora sp. CPCC 205558]|uniref:hypothetical protein n=1 Tax=Micromonospora sp. CPCC 205558 TaxID=3122403 RepID=UPI002FF421C0
MHPRTRATLTSAGLALTLALTGCAADTRNGDSVSAEQDPSATPADEPSPSATPTPPTAAPADSSPTGRPTRSRTPLPTLGPPTGPPREPSDLRKKHLVAGRINRGGDGPCYGLITDDGQQYALHGAGLGTFGVGVVVRVTLGPADPAVDCGPGIPASIVKMSTVG